MTKKICKTDTFTVLCLYWCPTGKAAIFLIKLYFIQKPKQVFSIDLTKTPQNYVFCLKAFIQQTLNHCFMPQLWTIKK